MDIKLMLVLVATTLAQQPQNPLGVKYSASTDVSHSSFNSPLVSYGDKLSKIQLPAAPIQPAGDESEGDQFISVQRYPHNPVKSSAQDQNVAEPQLEQQQYLQNQPQLQQQQYVQPQQQQYQPQLQQQQQYLQNQQQYLQNQLQLQEQQQQQYVQQQYLQNQPLLQQQQQQYLQNQQQQQQYLQNQLQLQQHQQQQQYAQQQYLQNQPQLQQQALQNNNYLATGQFPQPVIGRQVAPSAPFVSRVSFNRPTAGFSYEF